ncbi:MAG TPA: BtpA/SgcQ family protein [Candidatus Rifleibacterium sp.]|jgi:membrane complex biogenesis BtpA family protein|nr:BtpA/SgcQ family protein [Candidatus Rifleibacterium sp.]HPW58992.1 BtpA/SgcQ family protein [Candidatus Rifleibacterium sp.]
MKPLLDTAKQIALPALFGMVHVKALPGTPFNTDEMDKIVEIAVAEAEQFQIAGFDGIILENMHDRPYLKCEVGPEIVAGMTRVACEVKRRVGATFPVGIQILAGANIEALAVALISGCEFIRAEGCVFGHVADEGWIEACAGKLLRERARIGAGRVRIWTDIQKKHSAHAVTSDISLEDWVHGAEFFGIDGVIVTGSATGKAASKDEVKRAKKAGRVPVIVGSGITPANAKDYTAADAWIIGSSIKYDGYWENPLDPDRLKEMVAARRELGKK